MDSNKEKQKPGKAAEKAREKLSEAGEKAKEKLGTAGQKAMHKLGEAGGKAREAGEKAREKGKKLMGLTYERLGVLADSPAFRSITARTWSGVALAALYMFFMLLDQINYRWWIMLPLGAGGLYLLGKQWYGSEDRKSVDAKLCFVALVVLAIMVVYRDALLSEMMLDRLEAVKGIKEAFE